MFPISEKFTIPALIIQAKNNDEVIVPGATKKSELQDEWQGQIRFFRNKHEVNVSHFIILHASDGFKDEDEAVGTMKFLIEKWLKEFENIEGFPFDQVAMTDAAALRLKHIAILTLVIDKGLAFEVAESVVKKIIITFYVRIKVF